MKSSAGRSMPNDRRRLAPPPLRPPVFFPYPPMLPYNHPYAYTPPPATVSASWSFVPPQLPIPSWDTYIHTQTLPPPLISSPPTPTPALHPPSNSFPPSKQDDLSHKILKQIEYYFCDNNLAKDLHLKDQMDIDNGWVPIAVIAGFTRIKNMTHDIKLILDSLKYSDTIEVEGDKVRRRTTWKKWIAYRKAAPHGVRIPTYVRSVKQRQSKS